MSNTKRGHWSYRILTFLVVLALACTSVMAVVPTTAKAATSSFVIFIAPGHTPATGATAGGIAESTLNEAVSIKLGERLQAAGYTVFLTNRTKQKTSLRTVIPASEGPSDASGQYSYENQILPAIQQTKAAYNVGVKPNLVISMHHNSSSSSSARGVEIYYDSNCSVNTDYPGMNYGKTAADAENSKQAANIINSQLKSDLKYISVKSSPIDIKNTSGVKNSICRNSTVPSVLVEAGYMSNSGELGAISNSGNQDVLADSLVRSINRIVASDMDGPVIGSFEIGAQPITGKTSFTLSAKDVTDFSGVGEVQFWVKNGAGTWQVIQGHRKGGDTWEATFNASAYGWGYDTYVFNISAADTKGNRTNSPPKSIKIVEDKVGPVVGSFEIGAQPVTGKSSFSLVARNVTDISDVSQVQFWVADGDGTGTWKMIQGVYQGSDTWTATFNTSMYGGKHDIYRFNISTTDGIGNVTNTPSKSIKIVEDKVGPVINAFEIGTSSPTTAQGFAVAAVGVSDISDVREVQFWVVDDAGLWKMIQGTDHGNGIWDASFSNTLYGGKLGTYRFNICAIDTLGNVTNTAQQTVRIIGDEQGPTIDRFEVGTSSPTTAQGFAVAAAGVSDPAGVKEVQFWVVNGAGQWEMIQGTNHGNGTWDAAFSTSMFGGAPGVYTFNACAIDVKGNQTNTQPIKVEVLGNKPAPTIGELEIGTGMPTNNHGFALAVPNVSDPSGVKEVQFWVVNEAGTWRMIQGTDRGNGTWDAPFNTSLYGGQAGTYTFNACVVNGAGVKTNTASKSVKIVTDEAGPTIGRIEIGTSATTVAEGFAVAAYEVSDPSGVKEVQFWVVNSAGQWKMLPGTNRGNGTWDMFFDISMYGGKYDTYTFNACAIDSKGNRTDSASKSVQVNRDTQGPTIGGMEIGASTPTTAQGFAVAAYNVSDPSGVKEVQFWVVNSAGQWKMFQGTNHGNGIWDAAFSTSMYNDNADTYLFNVCAIDGKGNQTSTGQQSIAVIGHAIMGPTEVAKQQMINYYRNVTKSVSSPEYIASAKDDSLRNYGVDSNGFPNYYIQAGGITLEQMVDLYIQEGNAEGVRPDVAFAQMLLETGNLRFNGDVRMNQYNFAGIGATGGGNPGNSFPDVRTGIRAQIQHLKAYASAQPLNQPCVDPRYDIVIKAYGKASAPSIELLSQKWASGDDYGNKILGILRNMAAVSSMATYSIEQDEIAEFVTPEVPLENIEKTMPGPEATASVEPTQEPEASTGPPVTENPAATPSEEPKDTEPSPSATAGQEENDIMGIGEVSKEQALTFFERKADGKDIPEAMVDLYWKEAKAEEVKPEVAFAIAMAETNFLKYGQAVQADLNNPGGLKDVDGNLYRFDDLQQGVRAHIQHLKCYASSQECQNAVVTPSWDDSGRQTVQKLLDIGKMGYAEQGYGENLVGFLAEMKSI